MEDCFALLEEPRRPFVDLEALKAKFLALSAVAHPDRMHDAGSAEKEAANQRFAAVNAAYNCLRQSKDRLLHLLELESGARPQPVQRIPPGTADLFMEVGQLCRNIDQFLAQRAQVTSPMLRVRLFEQGLEWMDKLNALQGRVHRQSEALLDELQTMNAAWEAAPPVGAPGRAAVLPLQRLEQVYRTFSYVGRWTDQLQERLTLLAV